MSNRNHLFRKNLGAVVGAVLIATSAYAASNLANAQEPAATLPSASATPTIDEAKLDKFVSAYSEVLQLQKEANDKQSVSKDPNAAQAVATETQSKMTTAVKKNGLEIDEFNQIAQQMLQDDDLRSRIAAKMQVRNSSGG